MNQDFILEEEGGTKSIFSTSLWIHGKMEEINAIILHLRKYANLRRFWTLSRGRINCFFFSKKEGKNKYYWGSHLQRPRVQYWKKKVVELSEPLTISKIFFSVVIPGLNTYNLAQCKADRWGSSRFLKSAFVTQSHNANILPIFTHPVKPSSIQLLCRIMESNHMYSFGRLGNLFLCSWQVLY